MFTPNYSQFSISDCTTNDANRTGVCMTTTAECIGRGGRPSGSCFAAQQQPIYNNPGVSIGSSANQWQNPGIPVGICCLCEFLNINSIRVRVISDFKLKYCIIALVEVTCGATITQNGTYFRSPDSPLPFTESQTCSVAIQPIRRDICQLRLDFVVFDMARPNAGNCDTDRLIISGQSPNNILPALCGYITGQHRMSIKSDNFCFD